MIWGARETRVSGKGQGRPGFGERARGQGRPGFGERAIVNTLDWGSGCPVPRIFFSHPVHGAERIVPKRQPICCFFLFIYFSYLFVYFERERERRERETRAHERAREKERERERRIVPLIAADLFVCLLIYYERERARARERGREAHCTPNGSQLLFCFVLF